MFEGFKRRIRSNHLRYLCLGDDLIHKTLDTALSFNFNKYKTEGERSFEEIVGMTITNELG